MSELKEQKKDLRLLLNTIEQDIRLTKTLKQQRDDLLDACKKAFEESHNPKVEKILNTAIAKATHKP